LKNRIRMGWKGLKYLKDHCSFEVDIRHTCAKWIVAMEVSYYIYRFAVRFENQRRHQNVENGSIDDQDTLPLLSEQERESREDYIVASIINILQEASKYLLLVPVLHGRSPDAKRQTKAQRGNRGIRTHSLDAKLIIAFRTQGFMYFCAPFEFDQMAAANF